MISDALLLERCLGISLWISGLLISKQAGSGNPHRVGSDEVAVGFYRLPCPERNPVVLDCPLRKLVGFGVAGDVGLGEQEAVASHDRAAFTGA